MATVRMEKGGKGLLLRHLTDWYTRRPYVSPDRETKRAVDGVVTGTQLKTLFICYLISALLQFGVAILVVVYAVRDIPLDPIPNQYLLAYEGYILRVFDMLLARPELALRDIFRDPATLESVQDWWGDRYITWYLPVATLSSGFLFITAFANLTQAITTGRAWASTERQQPKAAGKGSIPVSPVPYSIGPGYQVTFNGDASLATTWLLLGRNPIRWTEYALSASWMVVLVGVLSTIQNSMLLLCMVVLNAVVMLCGLLHEVHNPLVYDGTPYVWIYYIAGWFICLVVWVPILVYFALMVTSDLPLIVIFIVVIQCLMFLSFSFVPLYVYRPWENQTLNGKEKRLLALERYYKAEFIYIALSVTVKLVLTGLVFFGDVGMNDDTALI